MSTASKDIVRILCVDDEPRLLEGLVLNLRKQYQVHTATSAAVALKSLKDMGGCAVVISDMRMPGTDGATLLKHVMHYFPETTRILLTGEPGREAAVDAINKGQIFRFLTKPCPPDVLRVAVEDAVAHHRLLVAEKVLLQETLIGCIRALIDVLAITNPVAFGRANRVTRLVKQLAHVLGYHQFWQLEAASMLSQVGYVSLPVELVEKLYYGERLTPEERLLAEAAPKVANNLLGHIPRMEPVLSILSALHGESAHPEGMVAAGAGILRLVLAYDELVAQGHPQAIALKTLRSRSPEYDGHMLDGLASMLGSTEGQHEVRELPLRLVKPGMVFVNEVRTPMGMLLVPKGFEVTDAFLERMRHFGSGILNEGVKVLTAVEPTPTEAMRVAAGQAP